MVEPDGPQMTVQYGVHAEWLGPLRSLSVSQYVIAFPRSQWFRERASLLRYTYSACLVPVITLYSGVFWSLPCVMRAWLV